MVFSEWDSPRWAILYSRRRFVIRPGIDVLEAAELLRAGNLVVFPTETVYGLGARVDLDEAVAGVYAVKGRPKGNPLIVHVDSLEMAERYGVFGEAERALLTEFAPGPLTVVVPLRRGSLSSLVTAGGTTVAIRIPDSDIALELIRHVGVGLAAPSANRSSRPSPTDAVQAIDEVGERVSAVLDGGACRVGLESTVVEIRNGEPVILRPGGITYDEIVRVIERFQGNPVSGTSEQASRGESAESSARSPGTRYRHYAPEIRVRAIERGHVNASDGRTGAVERGKEVSGMVHRVDAPPVQPGVVFVYASADEREEVKLFEDLAAEVRRAGGQVVRFENYESLSVEFYRLLSRWERSAWEIWIAVPPDEQRYAALRDRLFRAAGVV